MRIGPCGDPLRLWFLEYTDVRGQVWRRYYASRADAREARQRLGGAAEVLP